MNTVKLQYKKFLADTDEIVGRLKFKSSTTGRTYVIGRSKKRRRWECSCPSFHFTQARCKHIRAFLCQ